MEGSRHETLLCIEIVENSLILNTKFSIWEGDITWIFLLLTVIKVSPCSPFVVDFLWFCTSFTICTCFEETRLQKKKNKQKQKKTLLTMFSAIQPMYQNKKIFCLPVEPQVYYREYVKNS